jgi:hypothetical protein
MRMLVMAAVVTAVLTMPTQAQLGQAPGQGAPWASLPKWDNSAPQDEAPANASPKADDKAYKSTLDRIPPKQAHDPWANVREKPQSNNSR